MVEVGGLNPPVPTILKPARGEVLMLDMVGGERRRGVIKRELASIQYTKLRASA